MRKICFVTTVPLTIRSFVIPVIRYFSENTDWDITVICDDDPSLQDELPYGVRYIPVSMKRGISVGGIAAVKKLYDIFRREKFDLVQYSTPNAAFYASIASWMARVKHRKYHLMGFRYLGFTGIKKYIFKLVEQFSCFLSTDIECVSKSNLDLGIKNKVFTTGNAKVIFHGSSAGVDLDRFDISQKSAWRCEVRNCLGFTDEQCVFGFAGRITGDKGINELLRAFGDLPKDNNKLLLIGAIEEAGLNADLFSEAKANTNIVILEFVGDIERYYAAMDVLVLPSYREGFGNIVIEAQAIGLPVIVTDIPGPIDAMLPDQSGFVVPPKSVKSLASAMQVLSDDRKLRAEFGANGRKFIEECFDSKTLMKHILQERKTLLGD